MARGMSGQQKELMSSQMFTRRISYLVRSSNTFFQGFTPMCRCLPLSSTRVWSCTTTSFTTLDKRCLGKVSIAPCASLWFKTVATKDRITIYTVFYKDGFAVNNYRHICDIQSKYRTWNRHYLPSLWYQSSW